MQGKERAGRFKSGRASVLAMLCLLSVLIFELPEPLRCIRALFSGEPAYAAGANSAKAGAAQVKSPEAKGQELAPLKNAVENKTSALSTKPANRPVKDKWALVIGISKFEKTELNLKYADQDARDFADFLVNEANFSRDHIKILLNEKATRKAILSEMGNKWLPRVAAPDDLVVVFISSHGSSSQLDIEGVNYLLAYDSDPEDLYASGIDMPKLTAMIKERVHSERIVIVLDACHSGAAKASSKGLTRDANMDAAKIAIGSGQLVIASSMPNQVSWEFKDKPNSVFTRTLIDGLRVQGKDTTLAQAFSYMKQKVEDTVLRERGKLQTPVLKSVWEGNDLVLAAAPSSPRPAPEQAVESAVSNSENEKSTSEGARSIDEAQSDSFKSQDKTKPLLDGINDEIMPDPLNKSQFIKDLLKEDKSEEESAAAQVPSLKAPPLPDRVAIVAVSGTAAMERNTLDYMNNPSIILHSMISTKLKASLGKRLLNVFDATSALARTELAAGGMFDRGNVMALGRAYKARYLIDVSIERAHFDKQGNCYFATILRIFDGQTGEMIFQEGQNADCPRFAGKESERSFYIRSVVLPAASEQITQSILSVVNYNK